MESHCSILRGSSKTFGAAGPCSGPKLQPRRGCALEQRSLGWNSGIRVAEIQKSNLLSTVLQLKALGIDNVMHFDWLAPPPPECMVRALEILHAQLGIVDDYAKLTSPLGYQVLERPLDPRSAKMLLTAAGNGCMKEGLTIAAVMSVLTIWASGRERKEMDEPRGQFGVAEGDMVSYLNVYAGYMGAKNQGRWC